MTWPDYWRAHAVLGRSIFTVREMAERAGVEVPPQKPAIEVQAASEASIPITPAQAAAIREVFAEHEALDADCPEAWA